MKGLAFCAALAGVFALCGPAWSQSQLVAKWFQPVDTTNPTGYPSETYPTTIPSPGTLDWRVADDWKCTDGASITLIKWWGDYHMYEVNNPGPVGPPTLLQPTSFILRQYTNDATVPTATKPGTLIKELEIPLADCNQTYVQSVKQPGSDPANYIHIFSYETTVVLPWTQDKDSTYWLSVQAKFSVQPSLMDHGFLHWDWLNTPTADFLGKGLLSTDEGITWSNPTDPTTTNFAFELDALAPLAMVPSTLTVGQNFSVYLALVQDVTQPFDFYLLADTPAGPYTLYLNGKIQKGIKPLYRNVQRFTKGFVTTVRPPVKIPAGMRGKTITFYSMIVQAGKKPPVSKLSDLTSTTPYVILLSKNSAVVN